MIIPKENFLAHYGILRRSGRYPWGSGGPEYASNAGFLGMVEKMRKQGMTESEIAKSLDTTTSALRAARSIATNEERQDRISTAVKLKDKGMSTMAIARQMDLNESSVRSLLAASEKDKADNLQTISEMLKRQVADKEYIDVGLGVESQLGISGTKLGHAVAMLREEGYELHNVQIDQAFGQNKTTTKVLAPPGTTYRDIVANKSKIRQITEFSEDDGRTMLNIQPPLSVNSKRIAVRYAEQGGKDADGVIFVRPGVPDLSLGGKQYGQVRIAVDNSHFLKGMAVMKDDLPPGVDLMFNTNKSDTGNKLDAMKKLKDEPDNPFGSSIRQITTKDANGKVRVTSALNIVGTKEGSGVEGGWDAWSNSLSTQLLSKQSPKLAQQQLDVTYERKQKEFAELKALTNPVVRNHLIEKFSDGADSSAVHLKAAELPRQATKVILPVTQLKEHEVYAPTFNNGERVALVRYPHGGTFEIPELTVNNRNRSAQKLLGKQAQDAIGIHPKVAERLSGADFDGDTVVVIPNNKGQIKSTPALKELKNFDPQRQYGPYDGMKTIDGGVYNAATRSVDYGGKNPSGHGKGMQMGMVSNLITDMTIKGASPDELARAVKHSMVVIDAEKHHLDYKRSAQDNGIRQLVKKYQDVSSTRPQGGSSTLISKANSDVKVPLHKRRRPAHGGPIDPRTGKIVYEPEPESYINRHGVRVEKTRTSKKLAETDDAFTLVSPNKTDIEVVYAKHSNRMKALANEARKEVAAFKPPLISKSAKVTYASEVKSLNHKLNLARRNKPLERQAQIIAASKVALIRESNPTLDAGDLKKLKAQALAAARAKTGADKYKIVPTAEEWAAIQAGAISHSQLKQMLDSADLDVIRAFATPKPTVLMTPTKQALASSLFARGFTQAEVAERLGVSLTTLKSTL